MDKYLRGKTALVTGSSRGLGRAAALDLAQSGALVAINYATNERAARETLALIEAGGGEGFLIQAELGSYESAEQLASHLETELKNRTGEAGLDILMNNAGGGGFANIDDTTPEIFEKTISDNLRGPFYVTKLLKQKLRQDGRLIYVSSLGARAALPPYVVYALAKSAVETLTRIMAKELGPRGITVNCIMPGVIASDANADIRKNPALAKSFAERTALGRLGEPADFAGVVHALVSPGMGYVTGQIIEVSGGLNVW